MIKIITVDISNKNIEQTINLNILNDFNDFKKDNELIYCTMHQEKPKGNTIDVSFSTTIKYKEKLIDMSRLMKDFESFQNDNQSEYCQITKTSHQDGTLIAEFSVLRTYQLEFK